MRTLTETPLRSTIPRAVTSVWPSPSSSGPSCPDLSWRLRRIWREALSQCTIWPLPCEQTWLRKNYYHYLVIHTLFTPAEFFLSFFDGWSQLCSGIHQFFSHVTFTLMFLFVQDIQASCRSNHPDRFRSWVSTSPSHKRFCLYRIFKLPHPDRPHEPDSVHEYCSVHKYRHHLHANISVCTGYSSFP